MVTKDFSISMAIDRGAVVLQKKQDQYFQAERDYYGFKKLRSIHDEKM
jgi:hypothetical protein